MKLASSTEVRLRTAFGLVVDAAPVGAEFEDLAEVTVGRKGPEPKRRLSPVLVVGMLSAIALFVAGMWAVDQAEPAAALTIAVDHIEASYEIVVPLECDPDHQAQPSANVDIWGPGPDGLYRIELAYPDGTSEWFIVDTLVNVDTRRTWSPITGQSFIGDGLPASSCPPEPVASSNSFFDLRFMWLTLIVSTDSVVAIDGTTYTDAYSAREPERFESVAGVETEVFTGTRENGPRQTIWFDPEGARLQAHSWEYTTEGDQTINESITVSSRTTVDVDPALFDTTDVLLYSLSPGQ